MTETMTYKADFCKAPKSMNENNRKFYIKYVLKLKNIKYNVHTKYCRSLWRIVPITNSKKYYLNYSTFSTTSKVMLWLIVDEHVMA